MVLTIEGTLEVFLLAPEFLGFVLELVEPLQESRLFSHLDLDLRR